VPVCNLMGPAGRGRAGSRRRDRWARTRGAEETDRALWANSFVFPFRLQRPTRLECLPTKDAWGSAQSGPCETVWKSETWPALTKLVGARMASLSA
jgi:hypothetical protein